MMLMVAMVHALSPDFALLLAATVYPERLPASACCSVAVQ